MQVRRTYTYTFALLICSVMLCLLPAKANAQEREMVKTAMEKLNEDSIAFLRGVSVSVDLFSAVQRQVSDYGQYEASLRVNLRDRYFPVIELGLGDAKHDQDIVSGIEASTRAPYGRVGCDFNIMKNKHDDYRIYLGVRYAYTKFDFDVKRDDVTDPVYGGTAHYGFDAEKCYYHWMELGFTVDAKIAGPVRLGWSVRYRRRLVSDEGNAGNVWYVPGFGKAGKDCIGGMFWLSFEI